MLLLCCCRRFFSLSLCFLSVLYFSSAIFIHHFLVKHDSRAVNTSLPYPVPIYIQWPKITKRRSFAHSPSHGQRLHSPEWHDQTIALVISITRLFVRSSIHSFARSHCNFDVMNSLRRHFTYIHTHAFICSEDEWCGQWRNCQSSLYAVVAVAVSVTGAAFNYTLFTESG